MTWRRPSLLLQVLILTTGVSCGHLETAQRWEDDHTLPSDGDSSHLLRTWEDDNSGRLWEDRRSAPSLGDYRPTQSHTSSSIQRTLDRWPSEEGYSQLPREEDDWFVEKALLSPTEDHSRSQDDTVPQFWNHPWSGNVNGEYSRAHDQNSASPSTQNYFHIHEDTGGGHKNEIPPENDEPLREQWHDEIDATVGYPRVEPGELDSDEGRDVAFLLKRIKRNSFIAQNGEASRWSSGDQEPHVGRYALARRSSELNPWHEDQYIYSDASDQDLLPFPPENNQELQLRRWVAAWLEDYNSHLKQQRHTTAVLSWEMSTNTTQQSMRRLADNAQEDNFDESPPEAAEIRRFSELLEPLQARQMALIADRPRYPDAMYPAARTLMAELERIFSGATVCDSSGCYHGEPELQTLMETSRDPVRLLWAWRGWRDAVGPPMKAVYPRLISVLNRGARAAGFSDMGAVWRQELEMPDVQNRVMDLYSEVRPLLQQLHALVRRALRQRYGPQLVPRSGPIPAHLLGNLWAQSWESLTDLVDSLPGTATPNLSQRLRQRFSVTDFVKVAEQFYVSLGLPPMTDKFWRNSVFRRPRDGRNMTCHASSADFYSDDDFRILMCLERNERDFGVLHHEMGHIQYFMAYSHLPTVLRDGANSAFHEAVGDTFFYSIYGSAHLQRLGLIDRPDNSTEHGLQLLLQRALAKVPLTGYSLALDRWRWRVFAGHVTPRQYNAAWWQLRETLSGVRHPDCTAEQMKAGCHWDGMDTGAKFHVADNIPHIRYFLAAFLQLQFFEGLCEATYGSPLPMPLHECDLYGSRAAGDRLRAMMSLGKSRSWQDALEVMTGSREISARPLLRYFAPLHLWLRAENARTGEPVGWD